MPNPNYEQEYTRWLSGHVDPESYMVDTVTIYGDTIGQNRFVRWHSSINAGLENNGGSVRYEPAMFVIDLPRSETSTRQQMTLVFPSLEGAIYRRIKQIGNFSRSIPIFLTHRVYISTDFSKPMINPPVELQVRRVGASRENIVVELSVPQWTNRQSGRYYEIETYPGLFNV